ncbi:MAG: hypothetical protein D084_Lepto4C00452G0002 [Leptospirillum sp. Group IV 'UBA BS']|nr:MAG: hypothetical protein D084_Lepto4C00452G0002 [Leptospirillum sp. Group IV 'UBA BS']
MNKYYLSIPLSMCHFIDSPVYLFPRLLALRFPKVGKAPHKISSYLSCDRFSFPLIPEISAFVPPFRKTPAVQIFLHFRLEIVFDCRMISSRILSIHPGLVGEKLPKLIESFHRMGRGWQTRMNEALREWLLNIPLHRKRLHGMYLSRSRAP